MVSGSTKDNEFKEQTKIKSSQSTIHSSFSSFKQELIIIIVDLVRSCLRLLLSFRGWLFPFCLGFTTLLLKYLFYSLVYYPELVFPICRIHNRPHVKAVVVARFRVIIKWWSYHRHLVPVYTIKSKKSLQFLRQCLCWINLHPMNLVEHWYWTQFINLSQPSEKLKIRVWKPHIFFICLSDFSFF